MSFKYFVVTCDFSSEHQNFKSWKLLQGHSKWSFVRSQDHRVGRAFAAEISFVTTLVPLCCASDCGVREPKPPNNRWLVVVERCCSKITPTGSEIVISQIYFEFEDWNWIFLNLKWILKSFFFNWNARTQTWISHHPDSWKISRLCEWPAPEIAWSSTEKIDGKKQFVRRGGPVISSAGAVRCFYTTSPLCTYRTAWKGKQYKTACHSESCVLFVSLGMFWCVWRRLEM